MMSMSLRLEQKQELKQKQELQQKQKLKQTISLKQYQTYEPIIEGLIKYAYEKDKWVDFSKDGFNFNYALVPYDLAKPIAKEYGPAFAYCKFDPWEAIFRGKKVALAKGDWIKFVVEDKVPEEVRDYVAIHERGEELSLGNHYFASKLEFAYASKKKDTKKYIDYIDNNLPSKFVDLEEKVLFPILPQELIDFITEQNVSPQKENELNISEEMIEEYPIPNKIIKRMNQYSKQTDLVCKQIESCIPRIQKNMFNMMSAGSDKIYTLQELVNCVNEEISYTIKNLPISNLKALSKPKINQSLEILSNVGLQDLRQNFKSKVTLEDNLVKLVQKAKTGQSLINIDYTVEEKVRMGMK